MKRQGGLQPTPLDPRDFRLGAIVRLPDLDALPLEIRLPYIVKDQEGTDFCSAYATCAASEVQEGVELDPWYSFALSKVISGDLESWGQDLRSAMKAHVSFGAVPVKNVPEDIKDKGPKHLRSLSNWPPLEPYAYPHRKKSFFKVTGPYDDFDNARATLIKFKTPIVTGVVFGWKPNTKVLATVPTGGYGHAMAIVGYTKLEDENDYLIVLNSYGTSAGDDGVHYISREVFNKFADTYGQYTFLDIPRDDAEFFLESGIKLEDLWIVTMFKSLYAFIIGLFKKLYE